MWFTRKREKSESRSFAEQRTAVPAARGADDSEGPVQRRLGGGGTYFDGKPLPDWSTSPISLQRPDQSNGCPDVDRLAAQIIEEKQRGDFAQVRFAFIKLIVLQMDDFLESLENSGNNPLRGIDFPEIRLTLMKRNDFKPQMLVEMMTYFGPPGVAGNNVIALNFDNATTAVGNSIDEGYLG